MAAQVLARALGLDLYRVDLAGVVSKYIGETEKRLRELFDACERANVLLFFDEADALFGKRTQVKDAHDRFANIEIDYLLQRMEQFDGVAVLATNRKGDLDRARSCAGCGSSSTSSPPGAGRATRAVAAGAARRTRRRASRCSTASTWTGWPTRWTLTGAEIKNAALGAAFLARAASGRRSACGHVVRAAARASWPSTAPMLRVRRAGGGELDAREPAHRAS